MSERVDAKKIEYSRTYVTDPDVVWTVRDTLGLDEGDLEHFAVDAKIVPVVSINNRVYSAMRGIEVAAAGTENIFSWFDYWIDGEYTVVLEDASDVRLELVAGGHTYVVKTAASAETVFKVNACAVNEDEGFVFNMVNENVGAVRRGMICAIGYIDARWNLPW